MTKHNFLPHLSLLGTCLIFGSNYWIAKGLMPDYLTPFQIIFLRVTVTVLLFWITSLFFSGENIEKRDYLRLFICGLLGVVINQIFFFEGLRLTRPVETSILHTINPILVLIIAHWLIRERVSTSKILGILLGFAGALAIILHYGSGAFSGGSYLGNVFILINIFSYSFYLVLIKPLMDRYHPVTVMKWTFLFALIVVLPVTTPSMIHFNYHSFTPFIWYSLVYVVVGTTFLAYFMITFSLKYLTPTIVGFYSYLQPVVAAVIGIWFYDDKLTLVKILATLAIFLGVYLVNRPSSRLSSGYLKRQ